MNDSLRKANELSCIIPILDTFNGVKSGSSIRINGY